MAIYTTVAEVAQLRGYGEFTADTRPTLAVVEVFIDIIAAEMEVVISQNYQLPITEVAAPIAYRFLRLINQMGAAMMVYDSVNATISDPTQREKNAWRKPYEDRLERLRLVNSLPGASLIEIWDYPYVSGQTDPDNIPDTAITPTVPITPTPTQTVKVAWGWSLDDIAETSEFPDVAKSASDHVEIPDLPPARPRPMRCCGLPTAWATRLA